MMLRLFAASLLLSAGLAGPSAAQPTVPTGQSLAERIINQPSPAALRIGGLRPRPTVHEDATVQGGRALRIRIADRGANAYAVTAVSSIIKPVAQGDPLVLAFWARLVEGENGAVTARLPSNAIRHSAAPFRAVINAPLEITPEWKLYEVRGVADRDYAAGELLVSLHLASAAQTIDLGPVFVLNMAGAAQPAS